MNRVVIMVFCITAVATITSASVPSYVKVCGRRNPNLNACVKSSVEGLRGKLRSGIPELQAPALEPLVIDDPLTIANSETFSAHTRDVKLVGASKFDARKIDLNLETRTIAIDAYFDKLKFVGDYDIKVKIVVPISAVGPIEMDAVDVVAKFILKFNVVQHRGKDHMYFTSATCKLTIRDYTSHFLPGANQDRTFAEAINSVLNSNKEEIIQGISIDLEKSLAKKILEVGNKITKNLTYDEILPDRE